MFDKKLIIQGFMLKAFVASFFKKSMLKTKVSCSAVCVIVCAALGYGYLSASEKNVGYENLYWNAIPENYNESEFQDEALFNSVLSQGDWYKISIVESGLYKLSYADLASSYGLSGSIDSDKIRIYGNGVGCLSYENSDFHPGRLLQVPLIIDDGGDGVFNSGDAVYFFGERPDNLQWNVARDMYIPNLMVFDNANHYFVNLQGSGGETQKRIEKQNFQSTNILFDYHLSVRQHNEDVVNLIKSGRVMYGETFDFNTTQNFAFNLGSNRYDDKLRYYIAAAASSDGSSSNFEISINGVQEEGLSIGASSGDYTIAIRRTTDKETEVNGSNANFQLNYLKGNSSSIGYLDRIVVNYKEKNDFVSNSEWRFIPPFRDTLVEANAEVPQETGVIVLDATNHNEVKELEVSDGKVYFLAGEETKLCVSTKVQAKKPTLIGKQANQNLHALKDIDYLIVAAADFVPQANELADLHRANGLKVEVVEERVIYNEFSSGNRDIGGIRDFVKHLYHNASSESSRLKYLLLFGDGNYTNKYSSFQLPSYQSFNSESLTASYVSDDFFGFMDEDEAFGRGDQVDIGIGRFPVATEAEANSVLSKTRRYMNENDSTLFGDWRKRMAFVTDDQNGESSTSIEIFHMSQADDLTSIVAARTNGIDFEKLYLDAFQQIVTPGGERYPEANKRIREAVQNGALIVNYTGHGGELGWAHERILDVATINGWTNIDKLCVMVTATCEFSRFDDPARISAGEYCLLNPNGGAVALFTTTRLVTAGANFSINSKFYRNLFPDDGHVPTLGELYRLTKAQQGASTTGINHLNFSLLGDPALEIASPKNKVFTTSINSVDVENGEETIGALEKVRVTGYVGTADSVPLIDFNGVVDVVVKDKESELQTLVNNGVVPFEYRDWNRNIYKGKASVVNGEFTFEFIVPRDIVYDIGPGRISYYAYSNNTDAMGHGGGFNIGGEGTNTIADDKGPDIDLYMNETDFVSGDKVSPNPYLLARVFDTTGINTTGNGIGHDLVAFLDGDENTSIVLNNYFTSDLNTYQSGEVLYPYEDLTEGMHSLTFRAWDANNNPSEKTISFIVASADELVFEDLLNYPNPVSDQTTFRFKHNLGNEEVTATLKIYDSNGAQVDELSRTFTDFGYTSNDLQWNVNSAAQNIKSGTYVYALELKTADGRSAEKTSRMVVIR